MSSPCADLLILDAAQIVSPPLNNGPLRGERLNELVVRQGDAIAANTSEGIILAVAPWKELKEVVKITDATHIINASGNVVLPGFVDPHTHPIYAGSRVDEFLMRAKGKGYMDIHRAGGGIQKTVKETRAASQEDLQLSAAKNLQRMLKHGTTTVEVKSGYGLNLEDEIKILEIIQNLNKEMPIELYPTFMGAHAIPPEYAGSRSEYINLIIDKVIPEVAKRDLAKFCDIFCEEDAFTKEETKTILSAAKNAGLIPKAHTDEFKAIGGTETAIELEAISVDHLLNITAKGIGMLAKAKTAAVLLPGTSFFLNLDRFAPARLLIDAGVFIALGTDFNAGSCLTESMQMVCSLALLKMKMTPEEAINAATINSAWALGIGDKVGQITPGKQADLVVLDISDYMEFPYHFGVNLAKYVIKKGKVV